MAREEEGGRMRGREETRGMMKLLRDWRESRSWIWEISSYIVPTRR
jgi:hypothetical protein